MTDELVTRLSDAVLQNLLDRRGIKNALDEIRDDEPVWNEIRQAVGKAAIKAIEETHVLAPKKSTVEMNSAGAKSIRDSMNEANFAQRARRCFEDMLEALAHKGESDE